MFEGIDPKLRKYLSSLTVNEILDMVDRYDRGEASDEEKMFVAQIDRKAAEDLRKLAGRDKEES